MEETPFGIHNTYRSVSQGAEAKLFETFLVQSGTVELVDYMGTDESVARVATAGHGTSIFPQNPSLPGFLEHLTAQGLHTPFHAVQLKFNIRAPIEVALKLVYSRDANVNEYSGRYSEMLDSFEELDAGRIGEIFNIPPAQAAIMADVYRETRAKTTWHYKELLTLDFARELARSGMGINNDTKFFWKMDLDSLADLVVKGRKQYTPSSVTRAYIEAIAELAQAVAPYSWSALTKPQVLQESLPLTMPKDDDVVNGELDGPHWTPTKTKRNIVPALESILFVPRPLLNHGSLQPVDYMGEDSAMAQAARVSYGEGTKKLQDDINLVRSLVRDEHTSPIEMAELAIENKLPAFSDPRQAGRHRTLEHFGFMGYVPLGSKFYLPDEKQVKYQDRVNRQGRGKEMEHDEVLSVFDHLRTTCNEEQEAAAQLRFLGAPEELVRKMKGVGFFTKGWRTGDANNWGRFFKLRSDPHAQYEVRVYSEAVEQIFKEFLPHTYDALRTYKLDAITLSTKEQDFLKEQALLSDGVMSRLLNDKRFSLLKDKEKPEEGRKLNREGEGFEKKIKRLS